VNEHTNGCGEVVDPVERTLLKGAEVPQAGEHLLDRLGQVALVRLVSERVVQAGAAEVGEILVIGA